MKRLGLIGGMSWESTAVYYRLLNQAARRRLGGLHSADLLLRSVDFAPIAQMQSAGDWDGAGAALAEDAAALQAAGAEALLLCTNTMHLVAEAIESRASIPLLHLIDLTAAALRQAGATQPLLLGTRFTMEHGFYAERMARHGIEVRTPDAAERDLVHQVIYEELCRGEIREESRARWLEIVARHVEGGADGVIFGCTEVGMLLEPGKLPAPGFDSTAIHVEAAMDWALS